jgi:hypothetical protein
VLTASGPSDGQPAAVAVIIPAFNAADHLGQALASVAAQTRPPAEVVVSDDCSTDGTVEVARTWSDLLPITVVHATVNAGPAAARHRAIEAAASPDVALLDADDVWLPDHLATVVDLHQDPTDLVMADDVRWLPGVSLGARWSELYDVPPPDCQLACLLRENWVNSRTLFSRPLYERSGGFRAPLRVGEDWDLWIRMVRAGAVVVRAGHPTVLTRLTPGSASSPDEGVHDRIAVLQQAAREALTAEERAAVSVGLRHLRAEARLFASYRSAAEGRPLRARAQAIGGLRGAPRVAVRSIAMAVAPAHVVSRRSAVRRAPRARHRG